MVFLYFEGGSLYPLFEFADIADGNKEVLCPVEVVLFFSVQVGVRFRESFSIPVEEQIRSVVLHENAEVVAGGYIETMILVFIILLISEKRDETIGNGQQRVELCLIEE